MMRGTAWVTGAGGFIASYLLRGASRFAPGWTVVGIDRRTFDLLDPGGMERAFAAQQPDLIIHCAAMSRTGDCQSHPALARHVNVDAVRHLAGLAAEIPFVLFSTDLVFDGAKGGYIESDVVNPRSVYAETKAAAEQVVLRNPAHTVVRTSLTAGVSPSGGRAFNEEIKAAWRAGRTLSLFRDEYRCPLGAAVTARAVWELVIANRPGLYHLAGAERMSRLAIGQVLAGRWPDVEAKFQAALITDYVGPARSPDTSLNCDKLQALLSFPLPRFSEWLEGNPGEPL